MKKLIAVLVALPIAAFAQGGPARGGGPGPGAGPGGPGGRDPAAMQKRARLALTLGLAVALDLDQAQALKLGDVVAKSTERRRAVHEQLREAHQTLRRAAQGEKVSGQEVDQAIAKALDARTQLQGIDRDLVAQVTKDLSPEKKARAVLFLDKFQRRFAMMGRFMDHGGPGMMMRGRGPRGPMMRGGPGPGMRGGEMGMLGEPPGDAMFGACPGPDCDLDFEGPEAD